MRCKILHSPKCQGIILFGPLSIGLIYLGNLMRGFIGPQPLGKLLLSSPKSLMGQSMLPFASLSTQREGNMILSRDLDLLTVDAAELQRLLSTRKLTSVNLVRQVLAQIKLEDRAGTKLRAMISIAPEDLLLKRAAQLDRERYQGDVRGPLHGIPILIKVNSPNRCMISTYFQGCH